MGSFFEIRHYSQKTVDQAFFYKEETVILQLKNLRNYVLRFLVVWLHFVEKQLRFASISVCPLYRAGILHGHSRGIIPLPFFLGQRDSV